MQVINKVLVTVVSGFLLSFGSINAFALDKCHYESPNNILTPSGDLTKDDICNTPYMDSYENLYYYDGPKAFCGDNKAAFCAKVESKNKGNPPKQIVERDHHSLPLEKQYWYRALNYCGIDANAVHSQYCETYAKEGGWNGVYNFELNCKPADVSAFADRQCVGRESTYIDTSENKFCVRNYKGKLDPRFKKLNAKGDKPQYVSFHKNGWNACTPIMRPQDVKKGSAKLTVEPSSTNSNSSSSTSSSSSSNNSSGNAKAPENTTPQAPAGVSDALNKAKKLKDVFGF